MRPAMRDAIDHTMMCIKLFMLAFAFALGIRLGLTGAELPRIEMQSGGVVIRDTHIVAGSEPAVAVEAAP
jgi:hypothetical protein